MRIRALETRNFGRLPDGRVEFAEGLTVVSGPNEAGKSFTIRAIYAGLFDEAASRSEERESWRKWGAEGPFEVVLELECGDGPLRLARDLDKRKAVLTKADGTEISDKKTIERTVGELLGLPSLKSFQATACVLQDSVRDMDPEKDGLKRLLEGQLSGAGEETDALLKKLDKEIKKIRPPRARGILGELEEERARNEAALVEMREKLDSLVANKRELEKITMELAEKGDAFKDLDQAFQGAKKYREADAACEATLGTFNLAEQDLADWKAAQDGAAADRKRLGEIAPMLQALRAQAALQEALDDHQAWDARLAVLGECEPAIEQAEGSLQTLPQVAEDELKRARGLANEIDAKRLTLFEQLFDVKVEAEEGVAFKIIIDGEALEGTEARAHHLASVEFPGVGIVRMENITEGVPELAASLGELQQEYAAILVSYGAADVPALEQKYGEYTKIAAGLDAARARLDEALRGLSPEQLRAEAGKSAERLAAARANLDAQGAVSLPEAELQAAQGKRDALITEENDLRRSLAGHEALLKHLGEETQLQAKRDGALGALAVARSSRDQVAMFECDLETYAGLERRHGDLSERLGALRDLRIQLTTRIEDETVGEEDVAKAEEQLSEVQGKIARLTHRKSVLEIIHAQIESARRGTIGQFSEGLQKRMSEVLSSITGGKYSRVSIDGDLGVSLYSPEKNDWLPMKDDRSLSGGTRDQVFLAARIALLELIAGEARPPLIMDDTFCSFDDMGRKEKAFEVLSLLAGENQILYFTCQDCPADLPTLRLA